MLYWKIVEYLVNNYVLNEITIFLNVEFIILIFLIFGIKIFVKYLVKLENFSWNRIKFLGVVLGEIEGKVGEVFIIWIEFEEY